MAWIKLTDVGGPDYLNLDAIYKIVVDSTSFTLTFYDANSVLPKTYTFVDLSTLNATVLKFESIVNIIDVDRLATQG